MRASQSPTARRSTTHEGFLAFKSVMLTMLNPRVRLSWQTTGRQEAANLRICVDRKARHVQEI
jgi:hypothetical protein